MTQGSEAECPRTRRKLVVAAKNERRRAGAPCGDLSSGDEKSLASRRASLVRNSDFLFGLSGCETLQITKLESVPLKKKLHDLKVSEAQNSK